MFPLRKKVPVRYSVILACCKVEHQIDDFLDSILSQTIHPDCLEIIAVGSTHATADRIKYWSDRLPNRLRYVYQENVDEAAARNTGLAMATGQWISFPQPDGYLTHNFIQELDGEISRDRAHCPLSMVACNMKPIAGENHVAPRFDELHPLRFRFKGALLARQAFDPLIQLSAAANWFRRDFIISHHLSFERAVAPSFTDAHFLYRFLLLNQDTEVVYLNRAAYRYKSCAEVHSNDKAWYLKELCSGPLDLIHEAKSILGTVPSFVQRIALYCVFTRFRYLVDHPGRASIFSTDDESQFFAIARSIFSHIENDTIDFFDVARFTEEHKVGLSHLKGALRQTTKVYPRQYDPVKGLVQFSYFSHAPESTATALVEERTRPLQFASRRRAKVLSRTYFIEHFFWVPMAGHEQARVVVDGQPGIFDIGKDAKEACLDDIRRCLSPAPLRPTSLPAGIQRLRRVAVTPKARERYGGCWLLLDRDDKADDNAEHFYRFLRSIGKDKIFFVLGHECADWKRLEIEGFQLISFNSEEHHIALINSDFVVSSHNSEVIVSPLSSRFVRDLLKYRFVFLQHGVIHNDLSIWMNTKKIDRFITTTHDEYSAIAGNSLGYKFSSKEVSLTGLPRHDRLLTLERKQAVILFMPTWRKYLSGKTRGIGMQRERSPLLVKSKYAQYWGALLRSAELQRLSRHFNVALELYPHPQLSPFIEEFDVPSEVRVRCTLAESLQNVLAKVAVLVTDYSSVAFDVAYIDKPVVYFQFDDEEFFSGEHVGGRGYFDYSRHAFGPIAKTESEVVEYLGEVLSGREPPEYAVRRRATFPFRDGKCCARVYKSILALDAP